MRYLFTGGGTGGHVYPALAVADEIRRREPGAQFLYVGVRGRLEERVVPARGYPLRRLPSRPFPRTKRILPLFRFGLTLAAGVAGGVLVLLRFRPEVIFATGGFASAPVLFAGALLRRVGLSRARILVYEPNAHPGLLNRAAGRIADRIGVVFEQAARWFDTRRVGVVGFPVRRELTRLDREGARAAWEIEGGRLVLFVFGGSQGSRTINQAVVEALPLLAHRAGELLILHGTGAQVSDDYDPAAETARALEESGLQDLDRWYRRFDYIEEIERVYAAADLVVCRGGMSTLTEVGVCGLPAVILPLSTAAEDHQAINAMALESLGAARVLYEEAGWRAGEGRVDLAVSGSRLAGVILDLLDRPAERRRMAAAAAAAPRRDSLEAILGEIDNLRQGSRPPPMRLENPGAGPRGVPADPNLLLRHVRRRLDEEGGVEALCPMELAFLRYQADRHLASEGWYEIPRGRRNVGVKLVGLLAHVERLSLVLALLGDRSPATPLQRFLGGDYRHPGIVRRNAVDFALSMIGLQRAGPRARAAVLEALARDPYFEVRAAAARLLGEQASPGDAEVETALVESLDDGAGAVVAAALRALGRVGGRPGLLADLRRFYVHPDWRCRQETVHALEGLLDRGVLRAEEVAADVEQILSTSPNFEPAFPLKDSLDSLSRRVREGLATPTAGDGEGLGRLGGSAS